MQSQNHTMADDPSKRSGEDPKAKRIRLLIGDLNEVPERESNSVCVFLSSTFTDYYIERNILMKEAVPVLRKYCFKYGRSFQISDMRWGVRDEMQDDHATCDLCILEIERCQRASRGPYFVCFLGNRYGTRPYPSFIHTDEFNALYKCAKELGKETKLLDDWYYLDTNATPNQYVIQPTSSKFPHYNDESDENQELRRKENEEWWAIDSLLTDMFRASADKAYNDGLISKQTRHKYYESTTEAEIRTGILDAQNINDRTLYLARQFTDIKYGDKKAKRYHDLVEGEIDKEAQDLLEELKARDLPALMADENMMHSSVEWTPEGVVQDRQDHQEYLDTVKEFFIEGMKRLIDLNVSESAKKAKDSDPLLAEVLHHSQFCLEKSKWFCGRKPALAEIKQKLSKVYLLKDSAEASKTDAKSMTIAKANQKKPSPNDFQKMDEGIPGAEETNTSESDVFDPKKKAKEFHKMAKEITNKTGLHMAIEPPSMSMQEMKQYMLKHKQQLQTHKKPLIVHGPSGSGKTSLISCIAREIDTWASPLKPVKIIRYLGTSEKTVHITDVLMSLVRQIWAAYSIDQQFDDEMDRYYTFLVVYLRYLLVTIDTSRKPLYILLEGVDELSPKDYPYNLAWLPGETPEGVHFIVSMLPDQNHCLEAAQIVVPDDSRYMDISNLTVSDAEIIFARLLSGFSRTVNKDQKDLVMAKCGESLQVMFVALSAIEATLWHSYDKLDECILGNTIVEALDVLFDRLEKKHGLILFGRALGYLTASRDGLTDMELEDILSLDDDVLQDTYLYHLPFDPENIRLAPSLWRRIQTDLNSFLLTKHVCHRDLMVWSHSSLVEAATRRYLPGDRAVQVHSFLADYFDGKWAGVVKPIDFYKKKKGSFPDAKRNVPSQPLQFKSGVYNLRKLQELPYQLACSQRFNDFTKLACGNFEWLHARLATSSVDAAAFDLNICLDKLEACENMPDLGICITEVKTLLQSLLLSLEALRRDSGSFAVQILGQFPITSTDNGVNQGMKKLQEEATNWIQTTNTPALVPKMQCLPRGGTDIHQIIDVTIMEPDESNSREPTNHHMIENKVVLGETKDMFYVVDRVKDAGDLIQIYERDGKKAWHLVLQQHMPAQDIKSIHLAGANKYLWLETYTKRDRTNPTTRKHLLTDRLDEVKSISTEAEVLALTGDGKQGFIQVEKNKGSYSAVLNLESGKEVKLKGGFTKYDDAVFSKDASYLVTFCRTAEIAVWSVGSGKRLHSLHDANDMPSVAYVDFKRVMHALPGNWLLGRKLGKDSSKALCMWDLQSGMTMYELKGHTSSVDMVGVSHSQKRAVSGTQDTSVPQSEDFDYFRVWDLENGCELCTSKVCGPFSVLNFLGKHEDYIVACKAFTMLSIIWQIIDEGLIPVYEIYGHNGAIVYANVTSNGKELVTASTDNTVKIWSMNKIFERADTLRKTYPTYVELKNKWEESMNKPTIGERGRTDTTCFTLALDGHMAAVGTADGWILVYDMYMLSAVIYHRPDKNTIKSIIATTNNKYFIAAGTKVHVLNRSSGLMEYEFIGPIVNDKPVIPTCLAEKYNILVIGYYGPMSSAEVYDLTTGFHLKSIKGEHMFSNVVLMTNTKQLATTFHEVPVVYELKTGAPLLNHGHIVSTEARPTCLAVSDDDRFVAAGSSDGSIRVLDVRGRKYRAWLQHARSVARLAFLPDGRRLVSAGGPDIIVWDLLSSTLLHSLSRHKDIVTDLRLACAGRFLVTCSKDKQVLVWNMQTGATVAAFYSHCGVRAVAITENLSRIAYSPENIGYLSVLEPNPALAAILRGENNLDVSETMQKAQALALSFTGGNVATKTSQTCTVL